MKKVNILKKFIVALGVTAIVAGSLAGCGAKEDTANDGATTEETVTDATTEGATEAAVVEEVTLKIGATTTPHAEILEVARPILEERGIELEIVEYTDYVAPNNAVAAGDLDANFFQHAPYLENFNEENGTSIVIAGYVHYEPLGIYAGVSSDITDIAEGAKIAVPNDTTNGARALLLLEANGIITLREDAGLNATKQDVEENPKNIEIIELEAAQVSRVIEEVDFVVLNGNYALLAGLNVAGDALAKEEKDSDAAQTYANLIATNEGRENEQAIQILLEVLNSDEIKNFIEENYGGAVLPIN